MGDYGQDYQRGYNGGGWNSDTDMSAYSAGQWNRQREQEEAARRSQGASNWSTGAGGGAGGAGGGLAIVALMGLGSLGAVVWAARYLLMECVVAVAATATLLWLLMPLLGARPGWWRALGQTLLACLFALLGVVGAVGVAWLVSWFGGPELIAGIGYVSAGMISLFDLPANSAPSGAIFPGLAALAAATWWLDRKLSGAGAQAATHRALRRVAIAGMLVAGPVAGIWYALTLWGSFAPLDFDAIFDVTAPVSQSDMRRSALGAVVLGALLFAGVAALAARLLAARGWRVALPRKVAVRAGLAYLAYGALLTVMLVLFRGADPLVKGFGEALAPAAPGVSGDVRAGFAGLVLIQLVPFALFVAIARKAVAEPGALRRLALGAGAMLLLHLVTLVAIAAGWLLLFASA